MNKIREEALKAFHDYTALYDPSDIKIRLKIDHTFRVAELCERIARSLDTTGKSDFAAMPLADEDALNGKTEKNGPLSALTPDPEFAWFLGLLHDIGRFEQVKRYDTFVDRKSVDHAEFGADLLFREGLLSRFPEGFLNDGEWEERGTVAGEGEDRKTIAEKAIRLHNKLSLPSDLDEKTALYCNILRDADKCDIFRVLTEPPFDTQPAELHESAGPVRPLVMQCVREHRCIPRTFEMTLFESLFAKCCMAFELVFPESRRIVKEQGYLKKLLDVEIPDPSAGMQLEELKREVAKSIGDENADDESIRL